MSDFVLSTERAPPGVWPRSAAAGLTFRAVAAGDVALLERIYASTRAEELALTDWTDAAKSAFVAMQFRAQHTFYNEAYPQAARLLIQRRDVSVGRLYLERMPAEHRIVDVAFLPEWRGRGFGTALLADLTAEAAALSRVVTIHVEKFNPALRLYRRLGFTTVEDRGVYDLMRWSADQPKTAS